MKNFVNGLHVSCNGISGNVEPFKHCFPFQPTCMKRSQVYRMQNIYARWE